MAFASKEWSDITAIAQLASQERTVKVKTSIYMYMFLISVNSVNYRMEHDLPWVTLLPHECEATSGVRKALPTDRAPLLLLYDGYNMNDFVE